MTILNDGMLVVATGYWRSEQARRGYPYLTWNAGALRVLAPEACADLIDRLPPAGTPLLYLQYGLPGFPGHPALLWDDNPRRPFYVVVDRRQVDRCLPLEDHGREVPVIWYMPDPWRGGEAVREVRREKARVLVKHEH